MAIDFAGKRLVRFTAHATNGQVVVDGSDVLINGVYRLHWTAAAVGPVYVEKDSRADGARDSSLHYEVTTDEQGHVITAIGHPVRISGNGTDELVLELVSR